VNANALATLVIVPGLRDHVEQHWQTLLETKLSKVRKVVSVPPLRDNGLNCATRVEAIQKTVQSVEGPIIFVAHSAGVIMLVHWSQKYQHEVQGALLAVPPDFGVQLPEGYPTLQTLHANGWLPVPTQRLPFSSIVVASTNDPLATFTSVEAMANRWGSILKNVGAVGHLNPAAGFGEWHHAEDLIHQLDGNLNREPLPENGIDHAQ
jgi:uncharacterized protein